MSETSGRFGTRAKWAAVPVGMIVSAALIWQASYSAFTATTSNPTNNWSTGTVVLSDDDIGVAMFNATLLKPGSTASKCIVVTYSGTLASTVKLYGTGLTTTNGLSSYVDVVVEQGTGGTFANCTGFVVDAGPVSYSGTLNAFGTTYTNFANGFGTYAPSGASTKVYRITYTLSAAAPNTTMGSTASIGLTWEAQNS